MAFSLAFALLAIAVVLIVFLAAKRARGLRYALAAAAVVFIGVFALFVVMTTLITSSMQ